MLKGLKLLRLKNGITWSTDMTLKVRIMTDCQTDEERRGVDTQTTVKQRRIVKRSKDDQTDRD